MYSKVCEYMKRAGLAQHQYLDCETAELDPQVIAELKSDGVPLDPPSLKVAAYIQQMRAPATYGDSVTVCAMPVLLRVKIRVFSLRADSSLVLSLESGDEYANAYNLLLSGGHYEALVPVLHLAVRDYECVCIHIYTLINLRNHK